MPPSVHVASGLTLVLAICAAATAGPACILGLIFGPHILILALAYAALAPVLFLSQRGLVHRRRWARWLLIVLSAVTAAAITIAIVCALIGNVIGFTTASLWAAGLILLCLDHVEAIKLRCENLVHEDRHASGPRAIDGTVDDGRHSCRGHRQLGVHHFLAGLARHDRVGRGDCNRCAAPRMNHAQWQEGRRNRLTALARRNQPSQRMPQTQATKTDADGALGPVMASLLLAFAGAWGTTSRSARRVAAPLRATGRVCRPCRAPLRNTATMPVWVTRMHSARGILPAQTKTGRCAAARTAAPPTTMSVPRSCTPRGRGSIARPRSDCRSRCRPGRPTSKPLATCSSAINATRSDGDSRDDPAIAVPYSPLRGPPGTDARSAQRTLQESLYRMDYR